MRKWRTIRYTDDGCSLYQCLQCKEQWEARTAPGWFSVSVETPVLVEGGWGLTPHNQPTVWYAKRAEPLYVPTWKCCPYCGCEWEGPVRCNVDNERMLSERRLRIQNAMYDNPHRKPDTSWWLVQTYVHDRWMDSFQARIDTVGALKIHALAKQDEEFKTRVVKRIHNPGRYEVK